MKKILFPFGERNKKRKDSGFSVRMSTTDTSLNSFDSKMMFKIQRSIIRILGTHKNAENLSIFSLINP